MDIHDGTIDRFLAVLWDRKGSDLLQDARIVVE